MRLRKCSWNVAFSLLRRQRLDSEASANDTNGDFQTKLRLIEERRKTGLEIAQLKSGWDAVYDTFEGDVLYSAGKIYGPILEVSRGFFRLNPFYALTWRDVKTNPAEPVIGY